MSSVSNKNQKRKRQFNRKVHQELLLSKYPKA